MKANANQQIVVFWSDKFSASAQSFHGEQVHISCAPIDGSISKQKTQAERNCGAKLHMIAFCSIKSKAEFRRFLASAKHLKAMGNSYRVEGVVWDVLASLERRADQVDEEFLAAA